MKKCYLRSRYQNQIGQVSVSLMSPPPLNFPKADRSICSIFIRRYRTSSIDCGAPVVLETKFQELWDSSQISSTYQIFHRFEIYHRYPGHMRDISEIWDICHRWGSTPAWPSSICCRGSFLGAQCSKIRETDSKEKINSRATQRWQQAWVGLDFENTTLSQIQIQIQLCHKSKHNSVTNTNKSIEKSDKYKSNLTASILGVVFFALYLIFRIVRKVIWATGVWNTSKDRCKRII